MTSTSRTPPGQTAPEDCPAPSNHDVFRYCPYCAWTDSTIALPYRFVVNDLTEDAYGVDGFKSASVINAENDDFADYVVIDRAAWVAMGSPASMKVTVEPATPPS